MRGALVGLLLGLILGAALGRVTRLEGPGDPVEVSFSPCPAIIGESPLTRRPAPETLGEILQAEQAELERLWGTPMSSSPDPRLGQAAVEMAIAQLDAEWDAIDCEEFPCVALMLSEEPIGREELREQLGLPHAQIRVSTYAGERYLYIASIAFIDRPLSEGETRWVDTLAQRLHDRYAVDLRQLTEAEP